MTDRKRRPHNELKLAIRNYLASAGVPKPIPEIVEALKPLVGEAPASSYRSALQDTRYFRRVSRGVFELEPREN